jgi:hypothetical protein
MASEYLNRFIESTIVREMAPETTAPTMTPINAREWAYHQIELRTKLIECIMIGEAKDALGDRPMQIRTLPRVSKIREACNKVMEHTSRINDFWQIVRVTQAADPSIAPQCPTRYFHHWDDEHFITITPWENYNQEPPMRHGHIPYAVPGRHPDIFLKKHVALRIDLTHMEMDAASTDSSSIIFSEEEQEAVQNGEPPTWAGGNDDDVYVDDVDEIEEVSGSLAEEEDEISEYSPSAEG